MIKLILTILFALQLNVFWCTNTFTRVIDTSDSIFLYRTKM